ncbi:MAG: hypothetical protein KU29_07460 [Sulfurovum sp. FS06-10]|nr:MAG: hypothetical protein KU29_07460 [Sulfurovum sp. FS06-10]
MKPKIKRSDAIYLEIESFADYELTQCIAYEMAVRNKDNVEAINKIIKYHDYYEQNIKTLNKEPYNFDDALIQQIEYPFNVLEEMIYELEFFNIMDDIFAKDNRLPHKIYTIIDQVNTFKKSYGCYDYGDILNKEKDTSLIHYQSADLMVLREEKKHDGFIINTEFSIPDDDEIAYNENEELISTVDELSKKIRTEINYNGTKKSLHGIGNIATKIYTNFKRPLLNINDGAYSISADITVNINQPINELMAYLTYVKHTLSNTNDLKAPVEIIGVSLQKADNLICDKTGKCFDSRQILSKQERLADMFFIYDALNDGMTQRQVQNEIFNYYAGKGIETKTMDAKTLKKYKEIALDYIDNKRYKELITGVKIGI